MRPKEKELLELEIRFQQIGLEVVDSYIDHINEIGNTVARLIVPLAGTGKFLYCCFDGMHWDFLCAESLPLRRAFMANLIHWPKEEGHVGLYSSWYGNCPDVDISVIFEDDKIDDGSFWKGLSRHVMR